MAPKRKRKSLDQRGKTYLEHKERMSNMRPYGTYKNAMVEIRKVVAFDDFTNDIKRVKSLNKTNNAFMIKLNHITRTHGRITTFGSIPPKREHAAFHAKKRELKRIDNDNLKLGNALKYAQPETITWRPVSDEEIQMKEQLKLKFEIPKKLLEKYKEEELGIPPSIPEQRKLFRPEIYFDVVIPELRPVGRLVFQLYTEAAPQVVYELVKRCVKGRAKSFRIARLFPNLWLELDIKLSRRSDLRYPLEYDKRALSHDKDFGILSFAERYNKGFVDGILNIDISFRPLEVLNNKRVAFGRLVTAKRAFDSLCDFGTRKGILLQKIVIKDCGLVM